MEDKRPLVSIIVRTKDRPKLLKNAIKSISEQTYRQIEVVLVNDGGCDLNIEELKNMLGEIPLSYIRLEKNTGRAHAGNAGIENAKGDYIGFLDDDDEYYPEHIETLAKELMSGNIYIAYTDAELVFMDFDKQSNHSKEEKCIVYSQDFIPELFLIQNYIPFMCLLFNRSVFNETRIDETVEIFEDWKLLVHLSRNYFFKHINKVTAKYIQWSDELQINRRAIVEDFSRDAYEKILREHMASITPEILYTFCQVANGEKMKMIFELIKEKSNKRNVEAIAAGKDRIASELVKVSAERNRAIAEVARLTTEKDVLETEINKLAIEREEEKKKTEDEKDRILHELFSLQSYMADIKYSLGWKLIERYRGIKNRLAPINSKQRIFYELLLKSVKVFSQEGMKGFITRARRRIRFNPTYMKLKFKLKGYKPLSFSADCKITGDHGFVKKPVNIIIPVYNGYECLNDCINSVFKHTDISFHTLVIIDDKSPDERISGYLQGLKDRDKKGLIQVLSNDSNLGFVKTVNKGFKLSPNDVICLNSDTIVTKGWVDKLQRAAYSKANAATATPFSNYVTINGIPNPFQLNNIPNGMDIDTFAAFIERISLRRYPEIPAGVGFCLYIRRSVLEDIGCFDEKKFEKGYAEETDFCMRALKKGYVHVLDDASYIYHVGGVSFESIKDAEILKEKNLMIERNLETLRTLHPEYLSLVDKALRENLAPVHNYINLRIKLEGSKIEHTLCNRSKA